MKELTIDVTPSKASAKDAPNQTRKWLLEVKNGTVDLATGTFLLDGNFAAEKLPSARVEYIADAECPLWLSTLDRLLGGDQDLIDYLQRAIGYSITGTIKEKVVFVLRGDGHGKSMVLRVLNDVLGDYAPGADIEENHFGSELQLSLLNDARLIISLAPTEKLNESLMKRVTSGDLVSARRLYGMTYSFMPQYVLWMHANTDLEFKCRANSLTSRLRIIPFEVAIPAAERDGELFDKLMAFEREGILAWIVAGAVKYGAEGLKLPARLDVDGAQE